MEYVKYSITIGKKNLDSHYFSWRVKIAWVKITRMSVKITRTKLILVTFSWLVFKSHTVYWNTTRACNPNHFYTYKNHNRVRGNQILSVNTTLVRVKITLRACRSHTCVWKSCMDENVWKSSMDVSNPHYESTLCLW
jgi:hypothetical protein